MAGVEPAPSERSEPLGGPSRWARVIIYTITWLPAVMMMIVSVPRFEPIFGKLREKRGLPQPTSWLMSFTEMDAAFLHLPVVLAAVALLIVDEAAVRRLRRRAKGMVWSWSWVIAASLSGLVVQFAIVLGLVLPVFKMGAAVG